MKLNKSYLSRAENQVVSQGVFRDFFVSLNLKKIDTYHRLKTNMADGKTALSYLSLRLINLFFGSHRKVSSLYATMTKI